MKGFIRSALYARVSSQKQAEEMTVESQLAAIRARVRRDGHEVASEFEFCDAGYSGADLLRPEMERLRDAVASGLIDRLYVHSPDRLARKLAHQAIVMEEFLKQDCQVIFLNQEGLPETPEANLLLQMQGMIAEYEREKILERTRRGRRFAAKQGRIGIIARPPFGYRRVCQNEHKAEVHWEVNPTSAAHVRMMFELVGVQGCSLGQLRHELHERGIPSPTGNEQWSSSTLRGILMNSAYVGTAKYGKTRGIPRKMGRRPKRGDPVIPSRSKVWVATSPEEQDTIVVPAIVDQKLFHAAGERMEENGKRHRERLQGSKYLLSGLLICGSCGCAYCGRRVGARRHGYYSCIGGDKYRRLKSALCDNAPIQGVPLEERVWEELCLLLKNPERIRDELRRRRADHSQQSPKLQELESRVNSLRLRLDRLIDAHTADLISRSEFETRLKPLRTQHRREQEALESLRGSLQNQSDDDAIVNSLERFSAQVADGLANADFELKRELLKLIINRVEIHKDEIRIVYRVPNRPFQKGPNNRGRLQHWLDLRDVPCGTRVQQEPASAHKDSSQRSDHQ